MCRLQVPGHSDLVTAVGIILAYSHMVGLSYILGDFLRRLCLPKVVKDWSSRSLQVKLIKPL